MKMVTQGFFDNRWDRVQSYDVPANQMKERDARNIPKVDTVGYSEVVTINLGFIFCDIKGYTKLVDKTTDPKIIARIMTIYVTEMAAAIREHKGEILSIRGDGIIGVFTGDDTPTDLARCAITMSTSLKYIINKRLKSFQQEPIECRWGADYGKTKITRAGLYGGEKNDLIYIGSAINYASKYSSLVNPNYLGISQRVYNKLSDTFTDEETGWKWESEDSEYGNFYHTNASVWSSIDEPT